jgi:hypothetical protein
VPLDGSSARKDAAVHLIESVIGRVKDEPAWHTGGNANRAPFELDCKSLRNHEDSTPGAQPGAGRNQASAPELPPNLM